MFNPVSCIFICHYMDSAQSKHTKTTSTKHADRPNAEMDRHLDQETDIEIGKEWLVAGYSKHYKINFIHKIKIMNNGVFFLLLSNI